MLSLESSQKSRLLMTAVLWAVLSPWALPVFSQTATFTLKDSTGLGDEHVIYVLGYSATPGYYLESDGTWVALPQTNGQIPCYTLGTGSNQISQIIIDSSQSTLSARVYFFVDDQGTYGQCNNGTALADSGKQNGIFGTNLFSYTYNSNLNAFGVVGITQANIGMPGTGPPVYAFSEIGPGPQYGTIDVSQVDLYSFPMTITATVIPGTPPTIGNSSTVSFTDNSAYGAYMNNLAGPGGCTNNSDAAACAYLDLASPYEAYSILLNPGGFLASNTTAAKKSKLNSAFDSVIAKLWATGAPAITLNNGGPQGQARQEDFVGTVVSMAYPCNGSGTGCPAINALQFVGTTTGYVAYVFSPSGYADWCANNPNCPPGSISSSGNQVFSGSGVFATTAGSEYTNLTAQNLLPSVTTQYGQGTYESQVARLGLILTQAMNHGASLMNCPSGTPTWQCWNLETSWYPTATSTIYPDITQNLYAQFVHTATNTNGIPFFVKPPIPAISAGGIAMGMAYGFSNDEDPTPAVQGTQNPEVPSKMDGTVVYCGSGAYTITLGPWQ